MSVDRTLHIRSGVSRKRNVLSRPERIAILMDEDRFAEDDSPFGLPKTRVKHSRAGAKSKKAAAETPAEEQAAAEADADEVKND